MSCWVCQTADVIILTSYCVFFYFENNCLCIFTIFAGVKLTPAEEEDLQGRWQRAVGPRYEVIVSLSVISVSAELCNPKISVFKHCMFLGTTWARLLAWWYLANTLLNISVEGMPAGALWWDEWSWYQSGSSGRSPLPVLHLTRGTTWPKWQNLSWRPDFGGNWQILTAQTDFDTTSTTKMTLTLAYRT